MNEQIKLLAEQCGFKSNPDIYDRNQSFDISKFAELIVKECMSITGQCSTGPGLHDLFADNIIKEHFGVEE